jgi:O-antigen ligase
MPTPIRVNYTSQSLAVRTSFTLLWLVVFAIPSEGEIPVPGFGSITKVVGLFAIAMFAVALVEQGRLRPLQAVHVSMLALFSWICLSYLWSVDRDATAIRVVTFLQLLILSWMIWQQTIDESRALALMKAYVYGGFVAASTTIFNFVRGATANTMRFGDAEANGRSLADFQNRIERYTTAGLNEDELALLLAISLPLACYLIVRSSSVRSSLFYWIYIPVAVTAVILTGSRGGLITTLVALTFFPVTLRIASRRKERVYLFALLALPAALFLLPDTTWKRFSTLGAEITGSSFGKRSIIWRAGIETFRDHPFIGVGYDAYGEAVRGRLGAARSAHNSFLSILVELGVVGEALFLLLLASLLFAADGMPAVEKRLWVTVLLVWMIGVNSLAFEHRKATWAIFALLSAHSACCSVSKTRRALEPKCGWSRSGALAAG